MKVIAFLGINGAGKTTIAKNIIKEDPTIAYVCAGDLLRREIENKTPFGLEYEKKMAAGEFAPVEKMNQLLFDELSMKQAENISIAIVDGFPRNVAQLEFAKKHIDIELCVNFELKDAQIVIDRLLNRKRVDDTKEVIEKRMKIFQTETMPVIDYYSTKNKVVTIDASSSAEKNTSDVFSILKAIQKRSKKSETEEKKVEESPKDISDEIPTLKNKLDMTLAEFGLKDYAIVIKNNDIVINISNIEENKAQDRIAMLLAMTKQKISILQDILNNIEDEITEIQLTKIYAELDLMMMQYSGIIDNLDYLDENPETESDNEEDM